MNQELEDEIYNEDREAEARQEYYEMKRRRRRYSCSDGYCGADDCDTCRPGNRYHEMEDEDAD